MYGNCIYCQTFTRVNRLNVCNECYEVDEQLLQHAREVLQSEGALTVFELAEHIGIEPGRVFIWLQSGRLPARSFRYNCPLCGRDLLNGFCSCDRKSYTESPIKEMAPMARFYSTRNVEKKCANYWDRVSKINKRQKRSIWLFSKTTG